MYSLAQCHNNLLTRDVNSKFIKKAKRLQVPVQHDPDLTDDSDSPWLS